MMPTLLGRFPSSRGSINDQPKSPSRYLPRIRFNPLQLRKPPRRLPQPVRHSQIPISGGISLTCQASLTSAPNLPYRKRKNKDKGIMPRLLHSLIHVALAKNQLLHTLLRECRTLEQATAELRWLREFIALEKGGKGGKKYLKQLCERRGRGEPLQYILGTQPFGGLDILCERGVLIPRCVYFHLPCYYT